MKTLRVDRNAFSTASLQEPSDELAIWRAKTPAERLQELETLRQIAFGYDPATQRLQKVLEVVTLQGY